MIDSGFVGFSLTSSEMIMVLGEHAESDTLIEMERIVYLYENRNF